MPTLAEELAALGKLEDSIVATSDDFLHDRLDKILGRLVALAANADLRAKVLSTLSHILTRIKNSPTVLPSCSLFDLIRPEQSPFVINFSFTFLEFGVPKEPVSRRVQCAVALLKALSCFQPFSPHSNSLCAFILPLLGGFTGAAVSQFNDICCASNDLGAPPPVCDPLAVISDYFIDITLAQRVSGSSSGGTTGTGGGNGRAGDTATVDIDGSMGALLKDGVGSISQGLSSERVHRIVGRKRDATPSAELRRGKYAILSSFCTSDSVDAPLAVVPAPPSYDHALNTCGLLMCLPKHHTLFLLLVLSLDVDTKLAEAAQEKLRGSKAALFEKYCGVPSWCSGVGTPEECSLTLAVSALLCQYVPGASAGGADADAVDSGARTEMSDDLVAAVLNWVSREVDICTSGNRQGSLQVGTVAPHALCALSHHYGLSGPPLGNFGNDLLLSRSHWLLCEKVLEKCELLLDIAAHPTAQRDSVINYYDAVSSAGADVLLGAGSVEQCMQVLLSANIYLERSHLKSYWSNDAGEKFARRSLYRAVENVAKILRHLVGEGVAIGEITSSELLQAVCTLVATLFGCVDFETEDTGISTHLFQALHNTRELYVAFNFAASGSRRTEYVELMHSLVVSSRVSAAPKKRLMAYEWAKVLTNRHGAAACVGWASPLTLETLLLLLDDPSELVAQALQLEVAGLTKEMGTYQQLLLRKLRAPPSASVSAQTLTETETPSLTDDYQYLHNVVVLILSGFAPGGKMMKILASPAPVTAQQSTGAGVIRKTKTGIAAFVKLANLSLRIVLVLACSRLVDGHPQSAHLTAELVTVLEHVHSVEAVSTWMAVVGRSGGVCEQLVSLLAAANLWGVLIPRATAYSHLVVEPEASFDMSLVDMISSLHSLEAADSCNSAGVAELIKYTVALSTPAVRVRCAEQLQMMLLLCCNGGGVHLRPDMSVQACQFSYTSAGCVGVIMGDSPGPWRDNLLRILTAKGSSVPSAALNVGPATDSLEISNPQLNSVCNAVLSLGCIATAVTDDAASCGRIVSGLGVLLHQCVLILAGDAKEPNPTSVACNVAVAKAVLESISVVAQSAVFVSHPKLVTPNPLILAQFLHQHGLKPSTTGPSLSSQVKELQRKGVTLGSEGFSLVDSALVAMWLLHQPLVSGAALKSLVVIASSSSSAAFGQLRDGLWQLLTKITNLEVLVSRVMPSQVGGGVVAQQMPAVAADRSASTASGSAPASRTAVSMPVPIYAAVADSLIKLSLSECLSSSDAPRFATLNLDSNSRMLQLMLYLEQLYSLAMLSSMPKAAPVLGSTSSPSGSTPQLGAHAEEGLKMVCALSLLSLVGALHHQWMRVPPGEVTIMLGTSDSDCTARSTEAIAELLLRCSRLYLHLIRDRSLHVQDVTCLGLCHTYECAKTIELRSFCCDAEGASAPYTTVHMAAGTRTLASAIADEVICTLTKEKRVKPVVGYTAGAETSATAGSEGGGSDPVGELDLASLQEQVTEALRRANESDDQGTGAGDQGTVDVLAQMEEIAATLPRPNMNINAGTRPVAAEDAKDNFAAYATICKVAYKAGGAPIVFAVLALIRQNNILGSVDLEAVLQPFALQSEVLHQFDYGDVKKLVAMLFMARYDPSPMVRAFMNQLWGVIVVDSKHYATLMRSEQGRILEYCMQGLVSGVWRDRESACRALESYLPDKSFGGLVFPHLVALFERGLRAMDDVRDTTRVAALGFMKVLGDHIVYASTASAGVGRDRDKSRFTGGDGNGIAAPAAVRRVTPEAVLGVAMPLLLDKGLLVTFPEGKGYAMGLLTRIIKESKSSLDSWVVRLVSVLVEAMSGLEPASLQYMSFHTARLSIRDEELESMRVKMAQSSPLQDALTQCLEHTNLLVRLSGPGGGGSGRWLLTDVLVSLCEFLQRGVGLATRVTAATSLCAVVEKYSDELRFGGIGSSDGGADRREIITATEKAFYAIYRTISTPSVASSKALSQALVGTMGALVKIIDPQALRVACVTLLDRQRELDVGSTIGSSATGAGGTEDFQAIAVCINQIIIRGGERMVEQRGDVERNEDHEDGDEHVVLLAEEEKRRIRDRSLWKMLLSRAYIGIFDSEGNEAPAAGDSDGSVAESALVSAWKSTWAECLVLSGYGVKSSALVRILGVLLDDLGALFSSLSWRRRTQAMAVLADLVSCVGASSASLLLQAVGPNVGVLVHSMLLNIQQTNSTSAYVWAGKDRVVEVLLNLVVVLRDRVSYSSLCSRDGAPMAIDDVEIPVLYLAAGREGDAVGSVLVSTGASGGPVASASAATSLDGSAAVTVPRPSVSVKALSDWRINMVGLVHLLLWELARSQDSRPGSVGTSAAATSSSYRIAVARALATVEWSRGGSSIFQEFLPALCDICKIPLEEVGGASSCSLAQLLNSVSLQGPASDVCPSEGGSAVPVATPAVVVVVAKPRPKAAPALNMFGSRYSSGSAAKAKKPASNSTFLVARSTVSAKRKLTEESPTGTAASSPSPTSAVATAPAGSPAAVVVVPVVGEDTAIQVKILESIVHGWPTRIATEESAVSCRAASLAHWCLTVNLSVNSSGKVTDVPWSIRRVAFQLIKAVVLSHPLLAPGESNGEVGVGLEQDSHLRLLLDLVDGPKQLLLGSVAHTVGEDKKHTLLITAALQCAAAAVACYGCMDEKASLSRVDFIHRVKHICETVSSRYSGSPPVAEEVGKLQVSLRKYKLV